MQIGDIVYFPGASHMIDLKWYPSWGDDGSLNLVFNKLLILISNPTYMLKQEN